MFVGLLSPLAEGRGLKQTAGVNYTLTQGVAPRRGAWIETNSENSTRNDCEVAPRRGAWIETDLSVGLDLDGERRPSQRGVD